MEHSKDHNVVFIWLKKVPHKLNYVANYESFIMKDKEITKCFIEELEEEIKTDNHSVICMLLSLGLGTKKITRNLENYWNHCYNKRFDYDSYRDLLIQFPNKFKNKKYEIYKELGDIEFEQGKGHFIDVDSHIKEALKYYNKINAQNEIDQCLLELQKNKKNTDENWPKPIELIIPIDCDPSNENKSYQYEDSGIGRVTRTSSNNLIYKELNTREIFELIVIKNNIVAELVLFFRSKEDVSFDEFLDYFKFKKVWFFKSEIYEIMLPALFHFYENFKKDIEESKQGKTVSMINYVLPLDSLVLKFEGLLRLFLERKEINTLTEKSGKVNESVKIFEMLKLFENSLDETISRDRFIKEDKPYFEYIFGSDELNLRNEIAHSIFKKEYYSHKKVIYIIDAISRIGKYSIT